MTGRDEYEWTNTEIEFPYVELNQVEERQPPWWYCMLVMFCGGLVGGVIGSVLMAVLL